MLPGMLIGHRQVDRTCRMQMQFKLEVKQPDAKFEIPLFVRRSSARSLRACGARGNFGCWWTCPALQLQHARLWVPFAKAWSPGGKISRYQVAAKAGMG